MDAETAQRREELHLQTMKEMGHVRLVMDVSAEDDPSQTKIRYAWYASLEDAVTQAEHEMALPRAKERVIAELGPGVVELHPSGVRIVRVEDADGGTLWEPDRPKSARQRKRS